MANGSFQNYVAGANVAGSSYFGLYGEYTYKTNTAGNYTDITVDLYIKAYTLELNPRQGVITINGISTNFTSSTINDTDGSGVSVKIGSATVKVPHNNDGTKTGVQISAIFTIQCKYAQKWYETLSVSTIVDLPKINRASTFTLSSTSVNLGSSIKATVTKSDSSFYHIARFYINDSYTSDRLKLGTSTTQSYTIPESWIGYIGTGSSCKAYCNVATYSKSDCSDDSYIGFTSQEFTVKVPSSSGGGTSVGYNPTISSLNAAAVPITTSDGTSRNILVQNKNKVTVTCTASAGTGSTIKSYTFTCKYGTKTIATQTTTSSSVELGPFTQTGELEFSVTVTNSRSDTATTSKKITCYAYSPPSFKSLTAYRSDSSGNENNNGTYATCKYELSYASVNNTNKLTLQISYKTSSGSYSNPTVFENKTTTSGQYTTGTIDSNSVCDITATLKDIYGGTVVSDKINVLGAFRVFNITSDGTGIALGKLATETKMFDSRWPIRSDDPAGTMKNLTQKTKNLVNSNTNDTPTTWVDYGNLATTYYNTQNALNNQPAYTGVLLNVIGSDYSGSDYIAGLFFAPGQISFRYGDTGNNSFNTWLKLATTSDISKYEKLVPVVLYTNENGNNSTVSLSDSAANYKYLEIFYCDSSGYGHNSIKVYSPNKAKDGTAGKTIDLSLVQQLSDVGDTYIIRTRYKISGTSITPNTANTGLIKIEGSNTSGNYYEATSIQTFAGGNYIYITRVLGWNHD